MSQWIKCSDALPSEIESFDPTSTIDVLIVDEYGKIRVSFWSYEGLCWADEHGEQIDEDSFGLVTHWMSLPKAPQP